MKNENGAGTKKVWAIVLGAVDVVLAVAFILTFLLSDSMGKKVEPKLASDFKENKETYMNLDVTKEYKTDMSLVYDGKAFSEAVGNSGTVQTESGDGFVFPNSDKELLTEAQISERVKDKSTLRYAINEIYARHGYQFEKEEYRNYFNSFDWYKNVAKEPNMDKVGAMFSKTEKENVERLQAYSKANGWS